MEERFFDVVVIGGGPAGLTSALYSARAGAKTAIVENLVAGGQVNLTPDIENFPGFIKISGAELGEKMTEQATNAGAEILYNEIKSIEFHKDSLTLDDNSVIKYGALIIATGCNPRKLGVAREEDFVGAGVHFCGLCDGAFYRGKDLIVVGGGNHAVEEAIYLSAIAKSITLVNNVDKLTAQQALIDELPKDVKVYNNHIVRGLLGANKLTGAIVVDTSATEINPKEICADGVFVAIGRVPNTGLFRGKLDMTKDGYIMVNQDLRTSISNVFCAGDVCDKKVRQVVTACADGAIAGINASALK